MDQEKEGCLRPVANISDHELLCFVNDLQALLWRVEIPRSRIEILNEFVIEGLDEDTALFMKNIAFRDKLLLPGEKERVDEFFDRMKERKSASTVFRITNKFGKRMWLKLTGTHSSYDSNYYHGTLSDVTDTAAVVTRIAEDELVESSQMLLEQEDPKPTPAAGNQYKIDIVDALKAMEKQLHLQEGTDGLLFSEVLRRKGKVVVYYSGKAFGRCCSGRTSPAQRNYCAGY
ncbi:hypothetical protein [Halodesulfovibrio marinisediminis]|uniref:hypothetical protein n=1 Tax=Halodesulfovibrio marinisediminis TaxID=458711 RepID=UPI0009408408|nr:hypothetical protein [Halodesulfovibrio marinisediminis]